MDRSRRRELFWLLLIAACVALFVARNERHERRSEAYDRGGLTDLVRQSQNAPTYNPNDDVVTGSIAARPVARPHTRNRAGYYVPLGSYVSIDQATRRYLDLASREPALERDNKLKIETVSLKGDGTFHRLRMGNFATIGSAKAACSKAGVPAPHCPVIEAR
ncbi:MAG: SPOR domain-containing protein [Parvibaculum sp.]|uniref:SPOR domain-containing protein n=1 Tax=Parvibaculum sp. TaxID=2024848 RepID=UPI003C712A42